MNPVDATSGSLYFAAAANAAQNQAAKETQKQKGAGRITKGFSSLIKETRFKYTSIKFRKRIFFFHRDFLRKFLECQLMTQLIF